MNQNDIIALARAGFTAAQISQIAQASVQPAQASVQPAQAQEQVAVQPQVNAPANQVADSPIQGYNTAGVYGAQPVNPTMPITGVQSPYVPAYSQPDNGNAALMGAINNLTATLQANAMRTDLQPAQPTAGDVIASIINPPGEVSVPESGINNAMGSQYLGGR